ncbi:MAG: hypothetical protein ACRCXT_02845 [Paraclostridium sp.]
MTQSLAKTYSHSYLYNKGNADKQLFNYIMTADEVDKSDPSFQDIISDVNRRRVSSSLVKVLQSDKIVLKLSPTPLPKAYKVMVMKDVKGDNTLKVFIEADVIKKVDGAYRCNNVDILVAYIVSGMNQLIYYVEPKRIVLREEIIKSGARCFAYLFNHIIDYLYKVSITPSVKSRCLYLASVYYLKNILGKDMTDSMKHLCRQISGITDKDEEILNIQMFDEDYENIKTFIDGISRTLKLPKLTLDVFVEKWIFVYGVGTHFALELYPAFATMLTNCYVGCYLNNQKTIEKIVGRDYVTFTTAILQVGGESV